MIEVLIEKDLGRMTVTGHAKYGRKGEDIVCAAVSTLVHMLGAEALRRAGGKAKDAADIVTIEGSGFRYTSVLYAVEEELNAIAAQYPDEVCVTGGRVKSVE